MLVTCFSTARSVITSSAAIAWLDRPSAINARTSRSRRVSSSRRPAARPRPSICETTSGVERRAASGHATDRVNEPLHVRNPLLEEIANALGALAEQFNCVLLLHVTGENDHRSVRQLAADRQRGPQSLIGMRWGHSDVDDRDIGLVPPPLAQQGLGVASLRDHLEAGIAEQAGDTFPQEYRIFAQDYAHAIRVVIVVRRPAAISARRRAIIRAAPPAQAPTARPWVQSPGHHCARPPRRTRCRRGW